MQQNSSLFSSKAGDCSQMRLDVFEIVATLNDLHLFFDLNVKLECQNGDQSGLGRQFYFLFVACGKLF